MKDMTSPETVRKILDLRKAGWSYRAISKELFINPKLVRKYCVLYELDGIKTDTEKKRKEEIEKILHLYLEENKTPNEIAREMHKSGQAIRLTLFKQGVWEKREYVRHQEGVFIDKPMPPLNLTNEPVYYPERNITGKKVTINGKRYIDVSEVYGI